MRISLIVLTILFSGLKAAAGPIVTPTNYSCESTDPNIRPFYKVKIQKAPNANYYKFEIVRYDDLSGQRRKVSLREGVAKMENDKFIFAIGRRMSDGTFSFVGESLIGTKLLNGIFKTEMRVVGSPLAVIACK